MDSSVSSGTDGPPQKIDGKLVDKDILPDHEKVVDFYWADSEEPHRRRRMAIIKAHPEVRSCCPIDLVIADNER